MSQKITFTEKEWIFVQEVLINNLDDAITLTEKERLNLIKKIEEI